jgi:SAM-dependent methyltransferase
MQARILRARQKALGLYAVAFTRLLSATERLLDIRSVQCPVCNWCGLRFRPYLGPGWVRRNNTCPQCGSQERHRLIQVLAPAVVGERHTCLYFAPEDCLCPVAARLADRIVTTDLVADRVDLCSDIEHLPIATHAVDLVLCTDVLEHVAHDVDALRELCRVLALNGAAFIHVPVLSSETVEYGFAVEVDYGHRRVYGPDVLDRFAPAGLEPTPLLANEISAATRKRFGLYSEDLVIVATPITNPRGR